MATDKYKRLTCAHCKVEFLSDRKKQHCSPRCAALRRAREQGIPSRAEDAVGRRNPAHSFVCEHCGKESHRRPSATMLALGYPNRWCSMACRSEQAAERKRIEQEEVAKRQACRTLTWAIKRLVKARTPPPIIPPCTCTACGAQYQRTSWQRQGLCAPCGDTARVEKARQQRISARKKPYAKAAKLRSKAVRRAKERIEAESVDPIKVFERDKWRCQLCGGSTPRKLRGSYDPKAPELDHVIPLALGGGHTWANVQCACRECNIRKGAKPLGQMGFGFALAY